MGFLCLLAGSETVTIQILKPIRSTGDEVGLIFIPEGDVRGDQYKATGELQNDWKTKMTGNFELQNLMKIFNKVQPGVFFFLLLLLLLFFLFLFFCFFFCLLT